MESILNQYMKSKFKKIKLYKFVITSYLWNVTFGIIRLLLKGFYKMNNLIILLAVLLISCIPSQKFQEKEIMKTIEESKKDIENYKLNDELLCADNKCLFLAFWDFDGTILKGDCSEGLTENGKEVYKGLVKIGILKGLAKDYKDQAGVIALQKKYRELEAKNIREAYVYLPQIFAGSEDQVIRNFAREYFKDTLQKYYFPSSIRILEQLKKEGVKSYIISASADFFVDGNYETLLVEKNVINGIDMKIENGKITPIVIPPVTYAEGKIEKIKQILDQLKKDNSAKHIFIMAGFGNSYHTDGPFLKYISEQKLLVGEPISVMVNGGKSPAEYKGKFKEVSFDLE